MRLSCLPATFWIVCLLPALMLAGCGGVPYYKTLEYDEDPSRGVYHHVLKGQTLYSIAQAYGLTVTELQRANGIHAPEELEEGSDLWIPGASRVLYVQPTVQAQRSPEDLPRDPPQAGRDEHEERKSLSRKRVPAAKPIPRKIRKVFIWPVKGGILTSPFGTRNGKNHHGLDISAPKGTPIRAAGGGTVEFSGWGPTGYGKMIIIKHPGNLTTVYAHNASNLVKKGTEVKRGQVIARIGKTGRASGPHVHFEVRNDTHPKNPLLYLKVKMKVRKTSK